MSLSKTAFPQDYSWITEPSPPFDFNGPVSVPFAPWNDQDVDGPILVRFEQIARRFPDKIAVEDGVHSFTYARLWNAARHLAHRIHKVAEPGQPIAVLLPNSALFPLAALACFAAGTPYIPLDASYPVKRNAEIIRESRAKAVVVDATDVLAVDEALEQLPRIGILESLGAAAAGRVASPSGSLVILHTSGSTGRPKGVVNTPANILERVRQHTNAAHIHSGDNLMLLISHATIAGMRETFAALLNGATLHIADLQRIGIGGVLRVMQDRRISLFYVVPSVLRALVGAETTGAPFRSLRVVRLGGDIAFCSDIALFRKRLPGGCSILGAYSSTEVPAVFQWHVRDEDLGDGFRLPTGYLVAGTSVALIDEDGAAVRPGDIGEVVVRSRYLALGLWVDGRIRHDATAPDLNDPRQRVWRTGDLARLRPDGLFELHGRNDRQIKINGVRIDPAEVEATLRDAHGVADAAVVPQKTADQTILVAFVVARPPEPSLEQLNRWVAARVPRAMHPARIHFLKEIPRLPGFKPDIRKLAELCPAAAEEHLPIRGAVQPETKVPGEILEAVRSAWTSILDPASFARDAPWNESGGDSLRQVVLLFHIEAALKRRLSPEVLAPGMRPSVLVEAIARYLLIETSGVDQNGAGLPLVHLFPGILGDEPGLARFRASLRGRIRFQTLEYPDSQSMIANGFRFDSVVDHVLQQIRVPEDNEVNLAGYSFGGFVAFEVARRLRERGCRVRFLGLLDPYREPWLEGASARSWGLKECLARLKGIEWQHDLIRLFVRLRAVRTLQSWAAAVDKSGGDLQALRFRLRLTESLRQEALRDWELKPMEDSATLFRSQEAVPGLPDDLGWRALCRCLSILPVAGSHRGMVAPENIPTLCAAFLEGLEESSKRADSSRDAVNRARGNVVRVGG